MFVEKITKKMVVDLKAGDTKVFTLPTSGALRAGQQLFYNYCRQEQPDGIERYTTKTDYTDLTLCVTAVGKK